MKKLPFIILLSASVLLGGLVKAQTLEQLGLHSEGGPWKFYPSNEKNESSKNILLMGDSVINGFHQIVIDSLRENDKVDFWLTPKHLNSEHLLSDLKIVVSSNQYDVIQFNIGLHGWPKGRICMVWLQTSCIWHKAQPILLA